MTQTLSEILTRYHEWEEAVIEADGCITDELQATIEGVETALGDKLDGYADFIGYLKGQTEYLKSQEELYKRRRATIESSIDGLRERMVFAMQETGNDKIKTATHSFSNRTTESWKVKELTQFMQGELIKGGMAEYVFKPDMKAIKEHYNTAPQFIEVVQKASITIR
ncbi:MAG: hypothetical protein HGA87_00815 [Desulfobulbaceae bacterium]|nr:hypothetical protein [Desulfobulbaceae bacterium]